MMYAPYRPNADYDEYFEKLIDVVEERRKNDDDTLLFITGLTGSGKTNILFHAYERYDKKNISMDFIGLKRENFADALKRAKNYKGKRFVGYDEGNVNKRDSLTKWNKSLIDLLFAIRGLKIFQIWCNPSVNMLDKELVREKINGLIFVATKSIDKPRIYYYFTKEQVLEMLDKYNNLSIDLLKDKGKQYCSYIGWFKKYKGNLYNEYLKIKENRMESKIDEFHEQWGSKDGSMNYLTIGDIAEATKISTSTIRNRQPQLIKEGKLIEGQDFIISPAGHRLYKESAINIFIQEVKERADKTTKNLIKHNKINKIKSLSAPYIDSIGATENV